MIDRAPIVSTAVVTAAVAAVVLIGGCSRHEVTYAVNGETVQPDPPTDAAAEVDPCSVLSENTRTRLGLADIEPVELPKTPDGGCTWDGNSRYLLPNLTLWVRGQTDADPNDDIVDIAGVPVNVYNIAGTSGRLIAYFDDLTLSLNYIKAKVEIDTFDALEAAMTDVLDGYSRTA
ncbi:hypothetical protein CH293_20160 [Rhodococcus sp. 14-2470-1b]|uniref:DUF3558 domain-containing protein n=1 Tax=Rhodococcus sp. 14-2470-1b TaxID=2023149 RepID=UPI000B9B0C36|nr:DUF3558 domain-containing protein [Rhodococcus sp. 14-2470-1b]OZF46363.1 hypothetical protein CH293_20160 [Rhodococcus sp. 14-2470-1b]